MQFSYKVIRLIGSCPCYIFIPLNSITTLIVKRTFVKGIRKRGNRPGLAKYGRQITAPAGWTWWRHIYQTSTWRLLAVKILMRTRKQTYNRQWKNDGQLWRSTPGVSVISLWSNKQHAREESSRSVQESLLRRFSPLSKVSTSAICYTNLMFG